MYEPLWSGRFDIDESSAQIGRDCLPFSPELLEALTDIPEVARAHYASVPPGGSPPMLFPGVPHVLYKGQLDISVGDVSIVEV